MRGPPGRAASCGAATSSQSGAASSSRSDRARRAAARPAAIRGRRRLRFTAGRNSSRSTPSGTTLVVAREPLGRRLRRLLARSRAARRSGRAAARAAPCRAGSRAAPAEKKRRDRERVACRGARGRRGSAAPARSRGRCRSGRSASAIARFARTPTGTPSGSAARSGIAGPTRDQLRVGSPSCSARRPARRSAARFDGASTVTTCPRLRSARASPATCSLTVVGLRPGRTA